MYKHKLVVEGDGNFPYDMLRYDACFPAHEHDSYEIARGEGHREVELIHYGNDQEWEPTHGRWNSFGWKVTSRHFGLKGEKV